MKFAAIGCQEGICSPRVSERNLLLGRRFAFSSEIFVRLASQEHQLPDTGIMVHVGGHIISIVTAGVRKTGD